MDDSIRKADVLIEALPYLQAFHGTVVVAKYGGSAIDQPDIMRGILEDLVFLSVVGIRAVLVHGGGPLITRTLAATGKTSAFIDGMRVTDPEAMRVVSEELDAVNRRLVAQIVSLGGRAEGFGTARTVIVAEPHPRTAELGLVGCVQAVRTGPLDAALDTRAIPVVSPVGVGDGLADNINADDGARRGAEAVRAEKLVVLTNVRGILRQPGDAGSLISTLPVEEAQALMARGVIQQGMVPKVQACMAALRAGVKKTHIIDAAMPHAMLLEIFTTQGIGTEIVH
jgi:acetylglutamate kinase